MDPIFAPLKLIRLLAKLSPGTRGVFLVFFGFTFVIGCLWGAAIFVFGDRGTRVETPTGTIVVRDTSPLETEWAFIIVPGIALALTGAWYVWKRRKLERGDLHRAR